MSTEIVSATSDRGHDLRRQSIPLILLPGLGGDDRLFAPQRPAFPELLTPRWIEPEPNETLVAYAARFAKIIDPGNPCFIGGISFGGVVALEVATHLAARECYLLGSIRNPREMAWRLKVFRPISNFIVIPQWLSPMVLTYGGRFIAPKIRGVLHQLKDADSHFLRWAAGAILSWTPSDAVKRVNVVQIHGDRDWVFPIRMLTPDKRIPGAGHLVSLTHADEVNRFIRERMTLNAESDCPSSRA